jgi:hypothetical protein
MREPHNNDGREASATVGPDTHLLDLPVANGNGDAPPSESPHGDLPPTEDDSPPREQARDLPRSGIDDYFRGEAECCAPRPARSMNSTPRPAHAMEAITIKVRDNRGSEIVFKIKKSTKLNKLMDAFCERMGKSPIQARFFWDGTRITGEDTLESVCFFSFWLFVGPDMG